MDTHEFDVVVVGAGFAGMYLLHRLRGEGFSVRVVESGDDVGGTWYWNRYPGARCDVESLDYQYTFDPALEDEWEWSEKYATQPEILRYAQHVADRFDLRRDIEFSTRVEQATWDEPAARWRIRTSRGDELVCRHYVMASGCLSVPKEIDIPGAGRFRGETYLTGRWPHEGVDFTGKRVAVIGTGSSGIQSIPVIAAQAAQLTVFQRTPNFSIPAHNGGVRPDKRAAIEADRDAYRAAARLSRGGVPMPVATTSALAVSDEERRATYEWAWDHGGIMGFLSTYTDHMSSEKANALIAEFVREKIRGIVQDPETAEALCPKNHPIGAKRLCVDTDYYATYNLPHVRLVDLRRRPIATITETGIDLGDEALEFDAIVFATGFDAMTGPIVSVDITGRAGRTLKDAWAAGPVTYLGLMVRDFPNLFLVTGPGSPSVLSNMIVSIEQHAEWITDCLVHLRAEGSDTIEPTQVAVDGWVQHVNDYAGLTLMSKAASWYLGANVPGKPRVFMPYAGGVGPYRAICDEVVEKDWLGFERTGPAGRRCTDGVIRRVQPDVQILLDTVRALNLPPMHTMTPVEARAFATNGYAVRPKGPDVGEVCDGMLPGPAGDLPYRRYRPASPGPHPVVVYFHGGGWTIGSLDSDDPFCRDLCTRSGCVVVSVDYRHAPEAPFPAPVDDAFAALRWVADHADELGGRPGPVAVAGWSAGANLAAVTALLARDAGGPALAGQLLVTPVTAGDLSRPSHAENGEGYVLTNDLMRWFVDQYEGDPADFRYAPLRAASLAGLPPAAVYTCEFDPLRDEGDEYAAALASAGVPVEHVRCRGHVHTSLHAVDVLPSGAPHRAQMAEALRRFFA